MHLDANTLRGYDMEKLFITPNETVGACDSESIQNAVNLAHAEGINKVVIPRMNARTGAPSWTITETVRLPSDMLVVLDNCFMQMADDVVGGFFCSKTLFTERGTDLAYRMHNIHIKGEGTAVLDGGKPTDLDEQTQFDIGVPVRLNSPIFFMNVEGFSVENVTILHQRYWGLRFQFCSRGVIRNIHFDVCRDRRNQDGINLRCGCHDILIENISGQTGDDMIALSAIDRAASGMFEKYDLIVRDESWDIHDVTIRNVSGSAILHPLVTIRNHNGAKVYNIHIENLKDREQTQPAYEEGNVWPHTDETEYVYGKRYAMVLVGDNQYCEVPAVFGDTHDITLRDLYCTYSSSVITVGSVVQNLTVENVHAGGACRTVLTTGINDWGDENFGVKLDGLLLRGVHFNCVQKNTALIDFPYMRDGDYVRRLILSNVIADGVDYLARVHKRATECDIRLASGCLVPKTLQRVAPPEVRKCDMHPKPFKPDIVRSY